MTATVGHWRDTSGGQLPSLATWTGIDFDGEIKNDAGSNLTKPNSSTIQVGEALPAGKSKLFIANIKYDTSHNNRATFQGRFELTSGTGQLFTTYSTGYTRNTANRTMWVRIIGVLFNCSENAQVQIQHRRDTGSGTLAGGSVINASDVQVTDLFYAEAGVYQQTVGNAALGGTSRNIVTLGSNILETSAASIERVGNEVTIKGDNKRYLIFGSVAGDGGSSRTQRISNIAYGGVPALDTQVYVYQRDSANEYAGMALADVYETSTSDVAVTLQCFRGLGVAADQGGADVDGAWNTVAAQTGLCVIELNDGAEVLRSSDATGLQNLNGGITATMNAVRSVDFNDASSFTRASNTAINVETDHNMICFGNIFTARSDVGSGTRGTFGARITIDGADQSVGEHGNYTRGNQGTQDTFGGSFNPAGIYAVTTGQGIGVETFDAGDNGAGDRTQPGTLSFWALNLDTTEPASPPATFQTAWASQSNAII